MRPSLLILSAAALAFLSASLIILNLRTQPSNAQPLDEIISILRTLDDPGKQDVLQGVVKNRFPKLIMQRLSNISSRPVYIAYPYDAGLKADDVFLWLNRKGYYSLDETKNLISVAGAYCQQGRLVVDCGANVGLFTLVAASFGCRVLAVDANEVYLRFLRVSVALNRMDDKVQILHGILSASRQVAFDGWYVNSATSKEIPLTPVYALDDLVTEPPLYLKVDVEGWEPSVFNSSFKMLQKLPPMYVFFEITFYENSRYQAQYKDMISGLIHLKYTCKSRVLFVDEAAMRVSTWYEDYAKSQHWCKADAVRCQDEFFCWHQSVTSLPQPLLESLPGLNLSYQPIPLWYNPEANVN